MCCSTGRPSRAGTKQKWRGGNRAHYIISCLYRTGPNESVLANLLQYGLEKCYVDVLVSDAAHTIWRSGDLFDAIITDRKSALIIKKMFWIKSY